MAVARPRSRRLVFGALTGALVLAAVEALGLCAFLIQRHEWFSYSRVHAEQRDVASPPDATTRRQASDWTRSLVVHPYLGFAVDPESEAVKRELPAGLKNDPYGFQTASPPVQKRAPDKVIVAVTGGSVAYWLSIVGRDALAEELGKSAALAGKRVEVVTLALGGEFDVVINLDGFNDVALPSMENLPAGTFPFYPRSWHAIAGQLDDRATLTNVGRLAAARDDRAALAQSMCGSWLRWSIAANAIWSLRDAIRVKQLARLEQAIAEQTAARPRSYLRNGPRPETHADPTARYRELAQFWSRSSLQMARLAQSNGIRYFHFLQANQYSRRAGLSVHARGRRRAAHAGRGVLRFVAVLQRPH